MRKQVFRLTENDLYRIIENTVAHFKENLNESYLITEDKEGKNLNKARKLLIARGYSVEDAQKALDALRHDLPNARLADCKFVLGLTRMYLDGQLSDGNAIMQMNSTLKLLASYHADEYDNNLNGESADALIERFSTERKSALNANREASAKRTYTANDAYTIVRIPDAKTASRYGRYTSWCVTHAEDAYDSYTNEGVGVFYFCLRQGFENEQEVQGEGCPLDSYGLSMIAVSVDVYGECNTITCRWNHDNGGNDQVMTVEQLEDILGRSFYETFKPRTREELAQVLGEEGVELFDNGGRYVYRGGEVDGKIRGLIKSAVVEDGVNSIDNYAFDCCEALASISIPNSVTSIGHWAFSDCKGLKSITIPNSVASIGNGAFSECTSLSSITIPNSVTRIGEYAFEYCSSLTSITIPNSVTSIGHYAFQGCSGLTSITIPNSVTSIGAWAFDGCNGLAFVTIGNGVTSIRNGTFCGCSGLEKAYVPKNIVDKSVRGGVFNECPNLEIIPY